MTEEQFLALRQELKTLARKIKETKPIYKQKQREFSLYEREHGTINEPGWSQLCAKRDAIDATGLMNLRYEFRHKVIVYGMIRGLSRHEIEPRRTTSNMPDETYITNILRQYGFPTARRRWWKALIDWNKVGCIHEKAKRHIAKEKLLN